VQKNNNNNFLIYVELTSINLLKVKEINKRKIIAVAHKATSQEEILVQNKFCDT
jgi:hypothetical protein